jgi:hypothetical protein
MQDEKVGRQKLKLEKAKSKKKRALAEIIGKKRLVFRPIASS